MKNPKYIFIVGKPLQIIVASSIIKQLGIKNDSQIIIFDGFFDARLTYERMQLMDWSLKDIILGFNDTPRQAYRTLKSNKPRQIFIDCDVGFKRFINLLAIKALNRNLIISVLEEGLGTYRDDIYLGLKKSVFEILGIGTHYGGCMLTDNIYLFDAQRYKDTFKNSKKNTIKISAGVKETIEDELDFWSYIMGYSPVAYQNEHSCNIYLSSWHVCHEFLDYFRTLGGDKFVKPHPHIKEKMSFSFARTIMNSVPAELVFIDVIKKYKKVTVFHHGTSSERYVSNPNLEYVKIDR